MPVPIFTHPDCLRHNPGSDHPESPARLRTLLERARATDGVTVVEAASATREPLLAVHAESYLGTLESMSARGGGLLFLDTLLSGDSWNAVLGATGAVLAAVDHGHAGRGHAFAAVRPPGHHALAGKGMGFCLVNNVMVAARHAQRAGRARILIIDWDVHHGNGTQGLMEADPTVRYVSMHQHPWYPGTGLSHERGVGNVFNVPRGPGLAGSLYVADLWAAIVAATTDWNPDMILVSAGFDAMTGDPLGGFTLEPGHYADLTVRIRERLPRTPVVGLLEGGYAPSRVADGALSHIVALG